MSTADPTSGLIPARKLKLLTRKEQLYVANRLRGGTMQESARAAGLPAWMGRKRELPAVEALVEEATQALAEIRYGQCLIDATEIHEYLTDAIRARMSDIRNDDHSFKPRSEWPPIWDQMEEAGDVEVTYEAQRSHDGEDTDGIGGWEKTGRTVEKVKLRFASRSKLLELAMKHKGVDAMAAEKKNIDLNITVTAEEQRKMDAIDRRRSKVIEVKAE